MGWKDTLAAAQAALKANTLDEAETLLRTAELEKQAETMQAEVEVKTRQEIADNRLPFGIGATADDESATAGAVKAAYVKKYGEIDAATSQVLRELYGTDNYGMLRAVKYADMNRYCKYGVADPKLSRMVLLPADMIAQAIVDGVGVGGDIGSFKATMVEAQDTLLGYMVPEELNQDMIQRLPGLTVVRGLARKYTTGGDSLSFLVRAGGNKRYVGNTRSKMTSEAPTATYSTNALFGKLIIPVHVNLFKVPVSKSGLEDSKMDVMRELLMPEIGPEAALTEDQQFLIGTGSNEPQGILLDNTTGGPQNTDVVTQNTGQAADIAMDAVVRAPWKIAGQYRAKKNPSTAFAFTSATGGVLASLKDSTGAYLWTEMHGANAQGSPDTLRGWQYKESEALPEIAANTYPVIFGDFQGYRIVDRVGQTIQRYDDSATAESDSVVFYVRRRYGGQTAEGYRFVVIKCATPLN